MRDISKYVDTESPLYDKLLRLYEENKVFQLENSKGRNIHHIVLRSWSKIDGEETDNTEENLVSLTAADHILAHFYIWKISKSPYRRSAASAWYFMSRNLIKFGIDENTIICLIDKYNEELKLCDEERRKHMSDIMKGREFSEEHRKKISEANKGNKYGLGHKLSEEARKKISEANKGNKYGLGHCHKHTEETRKKISEATKRAMTEETRKKMSKALKGKTHKPMSEETKKKISEFNKGKKVSEETRKKLSKSLKGKPSPNKGKKMSEDQKKKISGTLKGKFKGKHWKLVDGKRVWY